MQIVKNIKLIEMKIDKYFSIGTQDMPDELIIPMKYLELHTEYEDTFFIHIFTVSIFWAIYFYG